LLRLAQWGGVVVVAPLVACAPSGGIGDAGPRAIAGLPPSPPEPAGPIAPGLEGFDQVVLDSMQRGGIPGASLAIAHRGKLVLARGYGYADVAAGARVAPETRFLLASVSKSITAVTVLRLVDAQRLALDARVVDLLSDLSPPPGTVIDPRWRAITVEMLLRHEGGWDRQRSGDPLGWGPRVARALDVPMPVPPRALARYMLGQPLDFTPGTQAVYSNFGYLLLGLVIERVTGEPYAQAVQSLTLGPMGITGLANGAARDPRSYLPGEARRYGPAGAEAPGGLLAPATFASGAWIGSTVDLVRFLSAVDGTRTAPVLSPELTRKMLSGDPSGVGSRPAGAAFGMGWDTVRSTPRGTLFEKNGGVLGTMTWIEHTPEEVDWALFFNRSEPDALRPELHELYVGGMRRAIANVTRWPEVDYFALVP
jgi:N-acyl-D-amino-acid deacylase